MNKFYISNDKRSDASFEIPGHWIIFLVYADRIIFCDSFGSYPESQFFSLLSNNYNNKKKILYMNFTLQNIATTACALHVITFATLFSYNFTVRDMLCDIYDVNNVNNSPFAYDKKAQDFIMVMYGEYRSIFYQI